MRVELVLLCAQQEAEAASAEGGSNAGDAGEVHSLSNAVSSSSRGSTLEALAAAWSAAEAAFPHLTVSLVPHASKLSLDQLAGTLLQRFAGQMHPMVNLQVWPDWAAAAAAALVVTRTPQLVQVLSGQTAAECLPNSHPTCCPAARPFPAAVQAATGGQHPRPAAELPGGGSAPGAVGAACRAVPLPPHPGGLRAGRCRLLCHHGRTPGQPAVWPRRAHCAGKGHSSVVVQHLTFLQGRRAADLS